MAGLLDSAKALLIREGAATLSPESSAEDARLVIGYAAFLHRQREGSQGVRDNSSELPRWLRWAVNNRIFGEKAGDGNE